MPVVGESQNDAMAAADLLASSAAGPHSRLKTLVADLGLGLSEVSFRDGRRQWSTIFKTLVGLAADAEPRPGLFGSLIHPEDRARVDASILAALAYPGGAFEVGFRFYRFDSGEMRGLRLVGHVFLEPSDQAGSLSILQDVTRAESPTRLRPVEGGQLRAARGLLNWSVRELAGAAHVSESTVRRLEDQTLGAGAAAATALDVRRALEKAGIVFTDLPDGSLGLMPDGAAAITGTTIP
jgi:hypothetical protein